LTIIGIAFSDNSNCQSNRKIVINDSPQSLSNKLTGTWKLIEFSELDTSTGNWKYDYGKHPKGYFTYTKSGIVNLNISAETTMSISEDSAINFNINLLKWLYNYSFGYFGTYTVDINKSVVTHHVTGGSLPWFVDTDQPRPFVIKGDTLIISDNRTYRHLLIKAD
jgi:hypothetical protein